jgi:hypothetical protein
MTYIYIKVLKAFDFKNNNYYNQFKIPGARITKQCWWILR